MPDDPDDLDAVLRRTMASLDRQAPPGYFEALPARTLARLDDPVIGAPPGDAGLQDIRDLASETRARLSSQRAAQGAPGSPGQSPPDDAAASSVWKAVALPGPARAAAVPDGAAPPVSAVSQPPTSAASGGVRPSTAVSQPSRAAPVLSPTAASAADSTGAPTARRGRRAVWVAVAGGLAAAGAVGYLSLGPRATERADMTAMTQPQSVPTAAVAPSGGRPGDPAVIARGTVEPIAPPAAVPPPPTASPTQAAAGSRGDELRKQSTDLPYGDATSAGKPRSHSAAVGAPPRPPSQHTEPAPARRAAGGASVGGEVALGKARPIAKRPPADKPPSKAGPPADPLASGTAGIGAFDAKPRDPAAGSGDGSASPSPGAGSAGATAGQQAQIPLDQLIGETGSSKPVAVKPKPSRTSLSTDDIKRGMTAVAGKAKACFSGTQGMASLRLTVAPSGRVAKVAVTGMFAGSPTGACVERAAGAARFPAWDGGPQSFNYSYLLSD